MLPLTLQMKKLKVLGLILKDTTKWVWMFISLNSMLHVHSIPTAPVNPIHGHMKICKNKQTFMESCWKYALKKKIAPLLKLRVLLISIPHSTLLKMDYHLTMNSSPSLHSMRCIRSWRTSQEITLQWSPEETREWRETIH